MYLVYVLLGTARRFRKAVICYKWSVKECCLSSVRFWYTCLCWSEVYCAWNCIDICFPAWALWGLFSQLIVRMHCPNFRSCAHPPTPQKTWNSGFMRLNFYLLPLRTLDRVCIGQEWRMGCVEHRSLVNFCGYWLLIVEFASVRIRVEKMLYILVNWNGDGCKEVTY